MRVGLKNAVEIVEDLVDCFDFAVNESCNQFDECGVSVVNNVGAVAFRIVPPSPFAQPSNIKEL